MYKHMPEKKHPEVSSSAHNDIGNAANSTLPGSTSVNLLFVDAFKRVAEYYKVVIGIRAPNPLGETLLRENYPSKNYHMKAKSSPTGPTAGFIAKDPIYSKVPANPESQSKQQGYIDAAVNKKAKAIDLIISKARIQELISTENLKDLGNGRYSAQYPGGLQYFNIKDDGMVLDDDVIPVKVMTNPPEYGTDFADPRPITADYDLFAIIPRENQSVNIRPLTAAPKPINANFKPKFNSKFHGNSNFLKPKPLPGQDEDENMGNLHGFGKTIVGALNKKIAAEGYQGGKLVWHNDETGNPFSPGLDMADKPIFVLPTGEVFQITTKVELLEFYDKLKGLGYSPEYSPVFNYK